MSVMHPGSPQSYVHCTFFILEGLAWDDPVSHTGLD